jgi:hypothetical protein
MTQVRTNGRAARWIGLPLAAVGTVVLVAACGDTSTASSTGSGATAATGSTATAPAAGTTDALATCLAQNGVTLPEGGGPGAGGAPPSGSNTPPSDGTQGGPQGGGGQAGGGQAGGATGADQAPPGVDASTWAAAQKACASLAPTPPSGSGAPAAG